MELNDLIFAGVKLVCKKIGVHQKTTNRKSKAGRKILLESQIRKLLQEAKTLKQNMKIYSDEEEKSRLLERKILLEETNQKVLAKEGRLKRYRATINQCRQNRNFQINERKFYQQVGKEWAKTYQQLDAKKAK